MAYLNRSLISYADTNVYGRPFDDLSILKNAWEAESVRILFENIAQQPNLILVGSDILKLEAQRTEDEQKRLWIAGLIKLCRKWVEQDEALLKKAEDIMDKTKLKPRDALHLASALSGGADYFLTFDDDFLRKVDLIEKSYKIKSQSPIDFVKKL